MKLVVTCMKDTVSGTFGRPEIFQNLDVSKRDFRIKMGMDNFKPYRSDLQLWKLGDYDDETGELKPGLEFIEGGVINAE